MAQRDVVLLAQLMFILEETVGILAESVPILTVELILARAFHAAPTAKPVSPSWNTFSARFGF